MLKLLIAMGAALISIAPAAAAQTSFALDYTTYADGLNSPVTTTAVMLAEPDAFTPGQWDIDGISGTRGDVAITGVDSIYNVFYYPATIPAGYGFKTFLDDSFAEIEYTAGAVDYTLYRGTDDASFYHEFSSTGNGLLIQPASFAIVETTSGSTGAVPEPGTWAVMLVGLAGAGAMLRRQRRTISSLG